MADLTGADCLSVEECTTVFVSYNRWKECLVEKTAAKESDIIKKVASIMDKHVPSKEEAGVLKGISKIDVLELYSFVFVCADLYTVMYYTMYLIYV